VKVVVAHQVVAPQVVAPQVVAHQVVAHPVVAHPVVAHQVAVQMELEVEVETLMYKIINLDKSVILLVVYVNLRIYTTVVLSVAQT
jgi:hypothetical protein